MISLLKSKKFHSALLLAGTYVVVNILGAGDAAAQTTAPTIATILENTQTSIKGASNLVYTGAYAGGITALMMGAFKLKAHAENPGQTPMQQGLARLAVGAGLVALPSVGQSILATTGNSTTDTLTGTSANVAID